MTKSSVAKQFLLCLLITTTFAATVSALNLGTITIDITKVASGFNISDSNGTSDSLVIRVNVTSTANLAQINVTNVSIRLLHQNATGGNTTTQAFLIGENINTSGYNLSTRSEFNFTFTSTNAPDGFRNYTIYVNVTLQNSTSAGDGANSSNGGTVFNLTIDNTVPTVTLSTPANLTNQTGASATFSFSVTDAIGNLFQQTATNFSCQLQLYGNATNNFTSTNVTNQSTNNFPIARNLAQGIYSWFANCTDTAGNVNSANIRNMIVIDSTRPRNTNISFSLASVPYGDSVSITCSGSDNLNGASALIPGLNVSLYIRSPGFDSSPLEFEVFTNNKTLAYSKTSSLGIYNVNCTVMDGAGNQNSTSGTFEVIPKLGKDGIVGKETTVAKVVIGSGKIAEYGALGDEAVSRLMATDATLRFTIGIESHEIKLKSLTETTAIFTISSDPFDLSMNVKDKKEIDLNNDGTNDVSIELHSIIRGKADLTITKLKSGAAGAGGEANIPAGEGSQQSSRPEVQGEGTSILTILIILAVLLVLIYIYLKFRGGKGNVSFSPKDLGNKRDDTYSYPAKQQQTYPVLGQQQTQSRPQTPIRNGMNLRQNSLNDEEQIRRAAFYKDRFGNQ